MRGGVNKRAGHCSTPARWVETAPSAARLLSTPVVLSSGALLPGGSSRNVTACQAGPHLAPMKEKRARVEAVVELSSHQVSTSTLPEAVPPITQPWNRASPPQAAPPGMRRQCTWVARLAVGGAPRLRAGATHAPDGGLQPRGRDSPAAAVRTQGVPAASAAKLRTSWAPKEVATLSGWNWTPKWNRLTWATPWMMSSTPMSHSLGVQAMVCSSGGREWGSTTSEWYLTTCVHHPFPPVCQSSNRVSGMQHMRTV